MSTVYTTLGGQRFHADRACQAFVSGRDLFGWLCDDSGPVYPKQRITAEDAALLGYTACRVCVPPALALPATGQTHGHEPWFVCLPDFRKGYGCARCRVRVRVPNWPRIGEDTATGWHHEMHAVPWPCTSAVILGLAPRGGTS